MNLSFRILYLFLIFGFVCSFKASQTDNFKTEQLKYSRVRNAYQEAEASVIKQLKTLNLTTSDVHIFFRVFKKENEMEIWVKNKTGETYKLYKKWAICSASGVLGPKRIQGDYQVPEGFYHIDRFNPSSSFHLSLGINYPNASDRILSDKNKPGGDIFIHGSCVSIGCLAMTDPFIKEIYLLAVEAKNNGQTKIPVHIFPFRMSIQEYYTHSQEQDKTLVKFWETLMPGYDYFEKNKKIPAVKVNAQGGYYL